jgi:hypothetical protein
MSSKHAKIPRMGVAPIGGKHARAQHNPEDTNQMRPVWSIRSFDVDGEWGRSRVSVPNHLWDDLFAKLRNYESMTWGEILKDKDRNHSVAVSDLTKSARERLKDIHQDDVDSLFRLRLTGKQRVWGIRDGYVLRLLWWDPDHEICPSAKKHT